MDGRIGAAEGDRQAAPTAEKQPFWVSAPPGIFSRWGHVTRPHNIIGWLFRPLCVTIAYGLRMSRLGVSEECHNVHLCPDLAKKPNVLRLEAGYPALRYHILEESFTHLSDLK